MNNVMTPAHILKNLKGCEVFAALSDTALEKIASLALEKQYEAGTVIFQGGDSAEELIILQEGKVALQMTLPIALAETGKRVTVDVATGNDVLGWSAIVEPYTYTLTAVCLQNVKTLSISSKKLRPLLEGDPVAGYKVLKELIKVVASRLNDTRRVLISERSVTLN